MNAGDVYDARRYDDEHDDDPELRFAIKSSPPSYLAHGPRVSVPWMGQVATKVPGCSNESALAKIPSRPGFNSRRLSSAYSWTYIISFTNQTTQLPSAMSDRSFRAPSTARFVTYCLLSLTSVAIYYIRPSKDTSLFMRVVWGTLPGIASVVFYMIYMINNFVNRRSAPPAEPRPPPDYTVALSQALVLLGQLAIWTQIYLAVPTTATDHSTDIQVCAIHFAMSFCFLSECEYYRRHSQMHQPRQPFDDLRLLVGIIRAANHDPSYKESRDTVNYSFVRPHWQLEFPPRLGWLSRHTCERHLVDLLSLLSFQVGLACLNYPIKRLANHGPNGDRFPLPGLGANVFFTPRLAIFGALDLFLQRPMRLFNRMLFWWIVDCLQRARRWWNSTDRHEGH